MQLAYALIFVATALWGASFVVIKRAVEDFPVLSFLGWRFALATLVIAPMAFLVRRHRPSAATWRAGIWMGSWLALSYIGQTLGLRWTSPSNSGFLTGLYVVFTPVMAWFVYLRHVPAARDVPPSLVWRTPIFWAVIIAMLGLALLSGASPRDARLGDLLTVGCALGFSAHIVIGERYAPRHSIVALNFVQFLTVAVICLTAGVALEGLPAPSASVWGAVVYTACACTVFGFGAQTYAQSKLSSTRVALALALEAPFAAFFGHFWNRDRLGLGGWIGALLVFIACLVTAVHSTRKQW